MIANDRELLTVMGLAELKFALLRRYTVREIAKTDLRFSLGMLAKRIRSLVRERKRIRASAVRQSVVFLVSIEVVEDDSLYNHGPQDGSQNSAERREHDALCAQLDAKIGRLQQDVQCTEKRIYTHTLVNATSHYHNFSVLDSFGRALDVLQKDLWSTAATPRSSFVVCDLTDCDQCAYRQDECVREKVNREQRWQTLNKAYERQ
jgi:hypothetical protein